jgi:hypothetical protein
VNLDIQQKEIVSKLPENQAFAILIALLKGEIEGIELRMESVKSDKEALWCFHTWKALRMIHRVLSTHPENVGQEIQDYLDEKLEAMGGVYFPPDPAFIKVPAQERFPFGDPFSEDDAGD